MSSAVLSGSARYVVERAGAGRWVIGGVASELSRRLNADVGFLRIVLFVAIWFEPAVFWLYAAVAVAIPRGDRRLPSWSGLVAGGRLGLFFLALQASSPGVATNETFNLGPEIWLVHGGVAIVALLLLFAFVPDADAMDEAACRRQVLLAAPVLILAVALVAGMALVPGLRWERFAAGAAGVAGVLVLGNRASTVFAAVFAAVVVFFAGAGARFEGGIGDRHVLAKRGGDLVVRRAAGTLVVDLRNVRDATTVHASVGAGRLEVVLPQEAQVTTQLHVGRGRLDALASDEGADIRRTPRGVGTATPSVPMRIVAEVGVGSLSVRRVDGGHSSASDL